MAEPENLHAGPRPNLPPQLTSLVGREREAAAIARLLGDDTVHLLTLTGPPGIGKTRLAIHVAEGGRGGLPDGVCFVNLAPVADPARVLPAIANALGLRQHGNQSPTERLEAYLADKRMLLLLDNFEQVLPAGPAVARLLRAAPGLQVLVTSRELLHLSGEHAFVVPPLVLPPVLAPGGAQRGLAPPTLEQLGAYPAVQLFVARARALQPDFVLDAANAPTVAEICRRLDGLPLAIELAAARVRHLPPAAILERLGHRLEVLTGGARDLPDRQRTLRATIAWSYALLDDAEQRLFRRLAAFRGGRTLAAVAAVCDADQDLGLEPLAGTSSLLDKSLLFRTAGVDGTPRYVMLETIHEFAREQLGASGEAAAIQEQHARCFTALAEEAEPRIKGPDQGAWLERLDAEQDNFRAALDWSQANDVGLGMRLAAALGTFWNRRGYSHEGRERALGMLDRAREAALPDTPAMARVLGIVGVIAFRQGDFVLARTLLRRSVDLYRALADPNATSGLVEALNIWGIVESRLADFPARRRLHEEALALATAAGDRWSAARSLYQLGHTARRSGDDVEARARFAESLAIFQEQGDQQNVGLALLGLGQVAARQGDLATAQGLLEQSLAIFRALGDTWGVSGALYNLGRIAQRRKDYARAQAIHEENLAYNRELGAKSDLAETLEELGRIAYFQGNYARAQELHQQALMQCRELEDKVGIAIGLLHAGGVAAVAARAATGRRGARPAGRTRSMAPVAQAVQVMGAAEALAGRLGLQFDAASTELREAYIRAARRALGPAGFVEARRRGQALTPDAAVALALRLPAPGPPRRAARGTGPGARLTRREREVAALVAQGQSNREIAEALVITERTVEGHVSHMLAKLDFRSRAQISAWAVKEGLTGAS